MVWGTFFGDEVPQSARLSAGGLPLCGFSITNLDHHYPTLKSLLCQYHVAKRPLRLKISKNARLELYEIFNINF